MRDVGTSDGLKISGGKVVYEYPEAEAGKIKYWSLPSQFLDNKAHSYTGNMTVWYDFTSTPDSNPETPMGDPIVILIGNGVTLHWNGATVETMPNGEKVNHLHPN